MRFTREEANTDQYCAAGDVSDDMVFCSDLLDALTQDYFSRKGNSIEEPLHVEDIKVRREAVTRIRISYQMTFAGSGLL